MKNPFVPALLVLLVGYPLTAAAHSLGLIPFPAPGFIDFLTGFIGVGLLAILIPDYSRRGSEPSRRLPKPTESRKPTPEPESVPWTLHTVSS
ncbi:MAG: hypothetical protein HZC55_07975 [Verrucomicrobia bacterium]|jgi:hypothetical protein|nr:hypothetical protein [Verrucomicrobiota bacterium]